MGFLAALKAAFEGLPILVEVIKEIAKLVGAATHFIEKRIELEKFKRADQLAEETGDTSELENLFNPGRHKP